MVINMKVFEILLSDYQISVTGKSKEELEKDLEEFIQKELEEKAPSAKIINIGKFTLINFTKEEAEEICKVLEDFEAPSFYIEKTNRPVSPESREIYCLLIPKEKIDFLEYMRISHFLNEEFEDKFYFGYLSPNILDVYKRLEKFLLKRGWELVEYEEIPFPYTGSIIDFLNE